jgi:hypothetical protein
MKFKINNVEVSKESCSSRKNEPYKYRNKMYIWTQGETIMENLINRHNRPSTFYKKEIVPTIMKWLEENDSAAFEQLKNTNWGWRQKCGCTCPCSPGFVSDKDGYYTSYVVSANVEFIKQ